MAECDSDSGLKNAVLTMADTIRQLQQTMEKISHSLPPPRNDEDTDNIPATDWKSEEGWETVRNTLQDQNKDTLDNWKDELNNLLVFAGLFSAIVTAFTVESYSWLQQDSGDVSNTLLAGISLQLSAFTLTSTFANSSFPAVSLPEVTSTFVPVSYAAPVNTLWVLSLTLSLISAFFAIAVQQWLRQLRLPSDMPVRRAVQLLAFRSDSLQAWQIPSIISLLPLLLQVSVILFLVGLLLLLKSLNAVVTAVFSAAALAGFSAFLLTVVTPLITIHCPYKSPIVPTVLIGLQCSTYPLVVLATPIVLFGNALLQWTLRRLQVIRDSLPTIRLAIPALPFGNRPHRPPPQELGRYPSRSAALPKAIWMATKSNDFCTYVLVPYVTSFGRYIFVDISQFWFSREYQYILSQNDTSVSQLESSSVVSVLLSISTQSFTKALRWLHSFRDWNSIQQWRDGFRYTVVQSLRPTMPNAHWYEIMPGWGVDSKTASALSDSLTDRHRHLLWAFLRRRDWTRDLTVSWDDGQQLQLLRQLSHNTAFKLIEPYYARQLSHILRHQKVSSSCEKPELVPFLLLHDRIRHPVHDLEYFLDNDDTLLITNFASMFFESRSKSQLRDVIRLGLTTATLALIAFNTSPSFSISQATTLFAQLATFIDMPERKKELMIMRQEWGSSQDSNLPESMGIGKILEFLCEALVEYTSTHRILPEHQECLVRVSTALQGVYTFSWTKPASLRTLDTCITDLAYPFAMELSDEGWDGFLVALVLAEDMVEKDAVLESVMEALVLAETRPSPGPEPELELEDQVVQVTDDPGKRHAWFRDELIEAGGHYNFYM